MAIATDLYKRRRVDEDCNYCKKNAKTDDMMPWHDANPRCESGKRNHCTCDTCY